MSALLAAVTGLIFGSFLSVLLARLGRKDGIIAGRSECPQCRHVLAWYDLVPLASYVMLSGRCRYCRAGISGLYPVLELTMAAVFGAYVSKFGGLGLWQLTDLALLFGLVALFFFDLKYQILPDIIVYAMTGLVLVRMAIMHWDLVANGLATGAALAAIFGMLYLISHGRWLGLGDVKLAGLVGLLFGYPAAVGVTLMAIWVGALVGVGLMLFGRANMRTALPFGSFWTGVAILTLLWPGQIAFLSELFMTASH